ncbi:uncharacterized protein JCM10292_000741 [Rhodotorula paludigena]|uniref:uncharacterized protein n=1 Tax=Rhodotorula paludigena TaxID=86838 RepID=UPI003180646E
MPLPPQLEQPLNEVVNHLYNLQTAAGGGLKRFYSAIFRDLPDRDEYPDYYLVIKEPRCLHGIMESMRRGSYSSAQAVAIDLFLIWSNAREYNEQGSMVYADADKLEGYMERLWRERTPPLPPFEGLPRPGALTAPAAPEPERKVKRIKLAGSFATPSTPTASLSGAGSTKLRIGPSASSASPAPTHQPLTLKLGGNRPPSATPSTSLPVLPSDASRMASPGLPTPSAAAGPVDNITPGAIAEGYGAEAEDGGAAGTPAFTIPTIPDIENGWFGGDLGENPSEVYLDIVQRIRRYTDASGRPLATPLIDTPDPSERPDYYQVVDRPVSLNSIEAGIREGAYPTPEAFDRDMHHLFTIAKLFVRPDTAGAMYSDLLVLQRLYQELTKQSTPAARAAQIANVSALSSVGGGPGNVQHAKNDDNPMGSDAKSRATTRPTMKDKVFLDSINYKGDVLKTGDWVHLLNPDNPGKPIIAQIWKTYKRPDSPQRCLSVCWYYRPEETVHPVSRTFYENEVFKTGVFVDHNVEDFVDRCFVMFFTKYTRGRPKPPAWNPTLPLYVCEFRYKDDVKAFKKIKSWSSCVPEEIRKNEYDFEPFGDDRVEQLVKVKSPFVRGVAGPGGLDSGNAPAAAYHFSQDGKPATAEEVDAGFAPTKSAADPVDNVALAVEAATALQTHSVLDGGIAAVGVLSSQTGLDSTLEALGPFDAAGLTVTAPAVAGESDATAPTPAELAVSSEAFEPLPAGIKSKFRNDALGDLLWFSAPAAAVPTVSRPTHSLAYLYWRAQQKRATPFS